MSGPAKKRQKSKERREAKLKQDEELQTSLFRQEYMLRSIQVAWNVLEEKLVEKEVLKKDELTEGITTYIDGLAAQNPAAACLFRSGGDPAAYAELLGEVVRESARLEAEAARGEGDGEEGVGCSDPTAIDVLCCVCGTIVHTCEKCAAHPDGVELAGDDVRPGQQRRR